MAIKQTTLLLGGEERTLKFGTVEFLKHAGDVWEGDPLELLAGSSSPKKMYGMIHATVYAGLKCTGSNESADKVEEWLRDADISKVVEVLKEMRIAMIGEEKDEKGEVTAQTQGG